MCFICKYFSIGAGDLALLLNTLSLFVSSKKLNPDNDRFVTKKEIAKLRHFFTLRFAYLQVAMESDMGALLEYWRQHGPDCVAMPVSENAEVQKLMTQHKDAILALPYEVTTSGLAAVHAFFDTVLNHIDKTLADAIRNDEHFSVISDVIDEHESLVSYFAYATLVFETIPAGFYSRSESESMPYWMQEAMLLIFLAPLSTSNVVCLRMRALEERLTSDALGPLLARAESDPLRLALETFIRGLTDFSLAADELHQLAVKLVLARKQGPEFIYLGRKWCAWVRGLISS
ncbi:hypothetical protein CSQ88_07950 [Iodobacter sp. BJB302]|nr:hypothetical protein CSQ88_07950 [Iodobacter sp. BJB302]